MPIAFKWNESSNIGRRWHGGMGGMRGQGTSTNGYRTVQRPQDQQARRQSMTKRELRKETAYELGVGYRTRWGGTEEIGRLGGPE